MTMFPFSGRSEMSTSGPSTVAGCSVLRSVMTSMRIMSSVSTTPRPFRRKAWKIRFSASLLGILRSLTMVILMPWREVCFGITTLPVHSEMVSMSVLISCSRNWSPTSSSVASALRPFAGPWLSACGGSSGGSSMGWFIAPPPLAAGAAAGSWNAATAAAPEGYASIATSRASDVGWQVFTWGLRGVVPGFRGVLARRARRSFIGSGRVRGRNLVPRANAFGWGRIAVE